MFPILKITRTADAAVPRARLCLVLSSVNAANVAQPAAAGATKFLGVSDQMSDGNNILPITVAGEAVVESDGSAVITAGDYLTIANATGQVKTQVPGFGGATVQELIGIAMISAPAVAGAQVTVYIQPMLHRP